MSAWRFYQGLRAEWRWYRFDDGGELIGQSDQAFAELKGCMENAESMGFDGQAYHVHTRQSNGISDDTPEQIWPGALHEVTGRYDQVAR